MVLAIAAVAAVAAVGAIAQAFNSAEGRRANKKELDKIRRLFESIVPPQYDVSVNDPPAYIMDQLRGAELDFSKIDPEDYKVVGQYSPEAAQYIAEQNPTLVQGTAASKEGRTAQIDALREFQKIAQGKNPELQARLQEAQLNAQNAAQSRSASALQDAQRRGTLGSGVSFQAALQGSGDAMAEAGAQSRAAAIEAYRQKLNAVQQSGSMGRQLAQDELGVEKSNADIINSFNERTSKNYQDYLNQRSQLANQAEMFNLQAQQGAADKNVTTQNEMNRFNLQNQNQLKQQDYGNRAAERNYQNSLAASNAQWAANEKSRQNQLKSQSYNDQLQRANGMAGIGAQQMQMNTQNTQDTNALISGLAQAGGGYFQNSANQDAENQRWERYMQAMNSGGTPMAGGSYMKTGGLA